MLGSFFSLVVSVLWHLACIAMMRPRYDRLSDTRATLISFVLAYIALSVIAHLLWGQGSIVKALFDFSALYLFFFRKNRNNVLCAVLFGALANAIVLNAALVNLVPDMAVLNVYELICICVCVLKYQALPADMKVKGYSPAQPASPVAP